MNRTDRLYAIVEALRAAGTRGRTAAWLSDRFEVSSRTIKRDVAALVVAGTDIVAQEGRGGGYQLARDAALPPLSFSAAEALAMAVAVAAEPRLPFAVDGRRAMAKVLGAMTPAQREQALEVSRRVWMRDSTRARPKTARTLDEAIRRHVVCRLDYEDRHGKASRRAVEPMAFARTGGHWYLLAWCRTRDAGRWFRLDRVRRVHLTREPACERSLLGVFGEPPRDAQPVSMFVARL